MSKKLIVIGGPTASGKTSLSLSLAKHFNTEILSADSRQCYREMDIGVAKPTTVELDTIKHHFINSHTIQEEVTAGEYERYGLNVLNELFRTNDVVICVGGTGLYIKALCEGLDDIPNANKTIKAEVEEQYKSQGLVWLQSELKKTDPLFYEQVDINNPMRLLRGLSFFRSHEKSILDFQSNQKKKRDFQIEYYAIEIPRKVLYKRIEQRVDQMMVDGLLEEVKGLKEYEQLKALQTVGYKELFSFLNGELTLAQAVDKIKQHTRNYAKRQITWFKNQGDYSLLTANEILDKLKAS